MMRLYVKDLRYITCKCHLASRIEKPEINTERGKQISQFPAPEINKEDKYS